VLLAVKSLAYGGDGVARAEDGRAVFVRGGCPGDTVQAQVVADKGRFLKASVREVVDASASRVKPPCPYFGECGGCQWQHVSYATQVAAKKQSVADALSRIGHVSDYVLDDVVMGSQPYGYRNKAEFTVEEKEGALGLGYRPPGARTSSPYPSVCCSPPRTGRPPATSRAFCATCRGMRCPRSQGWRYASPTTGRMSRSISGGRPAVSPVR
jgi:23S rRNA (uracil1939-C5)-methyltransferase